MVTAVILIALSESIMGLFGPGFTEGTAALVMLIVAQLFLAIQSPAAELLFMIGHQDIYYFPHLRRHRGLANPVERDFYTCVRH